MDVFDDFLFVVVLVEGAVCLAAAYAVTLLGLYGLHDRLPAQLGIFAVAALALVLTATIGDTYRTRHRRHHSSD